MRSGLCFRNAACSGDGTSQQGAHIKTVGRDCHVEEQMETPRRLN
jgi:hypothetical protein